MQMICRKRIYARLILQLSLPLILSGSCLATSRAFYSREQVADLVFPSLAIEYGGASYDTRVILRFSNPDSEIVILKGSNARRNVRVFTLSDGDSIEHVMGTVLLRNPHATPQDIALEAKVHESDLTIPTTTVDSWLSNLKTESGSLKLEPWIHLHGVPEYDFWIDSNGDSIHYHFFFVPNQNPQSQPAFEAVGQWMLNLRSEILGLEIRQHSNDKK